MKHPISRKLLSLFLAIALLVSCCPFAFAAEDDAAGEPEEIAVTTEATVETEAPVETEETETAEETEATEETEAAEEPTEAAEEETVPEETEPVELPAGLKGLPEGYVLSSQELAAKQKLADRGVAAATAELTVGEDYVEDILVVMADSEEIAQIYAEAFGGELVNYAYGIGEVRLDGITVPEALAAAQDSKLPLPAAYPNNIVKVEPIIPSDADKGVSSMSQSAPQRQNWNTWVNEVLTKPDPALKYPGENYFDADFDWVGWQPYQYMHDVVDSYAAWGVTRGKGVTVAVVDSGVKYDHEELADRVVGSISCVSRNGVNLPVYSEEDGHGTHVAGIIAATMDNGVGGAGIAPEADILNVRVLDDDGGGNSAEIAMGIRAAVDNDADIINLSLGGYFPDGVQEAAINYALEKDVTVIVAMGNDGKNTMCYPAAYDGVISVVASDPNNTRAQYSNYGSWADIAAPGTYIYSSVSYENGQDGYYDIYDGTSMATPVVAGIAALYKSVHPNAKPAEIKERLKETATKGGSDLGVGIANAANMLSEKPAAPKMTVVNTDGLEVPFKNDAAYCGNRLKLSAADGDKNNFIIYTLDGSTPSAKDGEVVIGEKYVKPIPLTEYAGKTITLKAAQVNGLGMVGTVLTQKVTVQTTRATSIEVSGPSTLVAGKTGEFTAVVQPKDTADQTVTWSIVREESDDALLEAKIDAKTGKLTTPKNIEGKLCVRATSVNSPDVSGEKVVQVKRLLLPVGSMTLNAAKASCLIGDSVGLSVATVQDTEKQGMYPGDLDFRWTSSNTKVATVDANGVVEALSKGTAIITCKVLDGSGKSAKCNVTVMQPVEELEVTGQLVIAPGASATYKAVALPTTANNKNVKWTLSGEPAGVTIDAAKGKVTVAKNVSEGSEFTVIAKTLDGSNLSAELTVTVGAKCAKVYVAFWDSPGSAPGPNAWHPTAQKFTSVGLFNVDLNESEKPNRENQIQLLAECRDKKNHGLGTSDCIVWSSSAPAIASVDGTGLVTAHKAGSARITAAAMDGSKKKTTITVKVTIPVSTMSLVSSAPKGENGWNMLALGKTVSNKVVFGTTYGVPTNQQVYWGFDCEDDALEPYVSFKGGRLSVKKCAATEEILEDNYGSLWIDLYAFPADGSSPASAFIRYNLVMPTTTLKAYATSVTAKLRTPENDYVSSALFYCDQAAPDFVVSSSNPAVANPLGVDSTNKPGWYKVWFSPEKVGNAKITIKTTDGTNKTCSISVKVTP